MVQRVRHVGELDEVAEVLDARVATPFIEVAHERRTVRGHEDRRIATDTHITSGVAGHLRELAWRVFANELSAHATRHAHAFTIDVRSGLAPDLENFGVLAKFDANLFEDAIGVVLDDREALFAEYFKARDLAHDVRL